MTTTATELVWDLAGRPELTGSTGALLRDEPGICVMCGHEQDRTADARKAVGGNFTDQYLYRRSDSVRVCIACLWCCGGKPPATPRMWSVVAAPGVELPDHHPKCWLPPRPGLCFTNRASTRPVADTLLNPPETPWVVGVATSGQKHVIPYLRVNRGKTWTVRMENTDITSTSDEWLMVLIAAAALRSLKHSADAIREGRPDLARITTHTDWDAWEAHAEPLKPYVDSPLLELALWCLTKETITHYAPSGPTPPGRDDPVVEQPVGLSLF